MQVDFGGSSALSHLLFRPPSVCSESKMAAKHSKDENHQNRLFRGGIFFGGGGGGVVSVTIEIALLFANAWRCEM